MTTTVIKLGGELMDAAHQEELKAIAADIGALMQAGHTVVVVHGGGPQATALQKRLGMEPRMVGGRRITDEGTLEVMKMAVAGAVNVDLCARLTAAGARPVGLHGASSLAVRAKRRPPLVVSGGGPDPVDFGFVGDVQSVNTELLGLLGKNGYVPVMACLGADEQGNTFNINADTVANQVAVALKADALLLITGTPGVLKDVKDPGSRIPVLTRADGNAAIKDGTIGAGMIPKVEESFKALDEGVSQVIILGRLTVGQLKRAVLEPGSVGTVLKN
ncbi:MAG: acetylglutamate kinase [Myxococcota bacterium]